MTTPACSNCRYYTSEHGIQTCTHPYAIDVSKTHGWYRLAFPDAYAQCYSIDPAARWAPIPPPPTFTEKLARLFA